MGSKASLIIVLLFILTSTAAATFTKEKVSDCGYSFGIILTGEDYKKAQDYNRMWSSFEQSFLNSFVGNEKYIAMIEGDTYAVGISNFVKDTYFKDNLMEETSNKLDAAEFIMRAMIGIKSFDPRPALIGFLGSQSIDFGIAWKAHSVISEATKLYPYDLYDGVSIYVATSCCQPFFCPADWIITHVPKSQPKEGAPEEGAPEEGAPEEGPVKPAKRPVEEPAEEWCPEGCGVSIMTGECVCRGDCPSGYYYDPTEGCISKGPIPEVAI